MCFFKQKTANKMRMSYWSSDVCSSDLPRIVVAFEERDCRQARERQHQRPRGDERAAAGDDVQAVFEALELAPGGRAGAAGEVDALREEGVQVGLVGLERLPGLVDHGLRLRRVCDRLGEGREHCAQGNSDQWSAGGV